MNRSDILLHSALAIIALTAMNRYMYQDSLPRAIFYAVGVVTFFWLGRLSVRTLRKRRQESRTINK